jgi:hypothetical protein
MTDVNHEEIYQVALEKFPYDLDPTGYTQGDYESDDDFIEYGEE